MVSASKCFTSGVIVALAMFFFIDVFTRRSRRSFSFLPKGPQSHEEFDERIKRMRPVQPLNFKDHEDYSHVAEDLIAKTLYKKVRVFCWIMTRPSQHKKKAVPVKATWAKRCNKHIFISSQDDPDLPAINVHVKEGRNHLWGKTKAAFKYIYEHEIDNFDFFMKADDDTFVVLENLRYLLRNVDPNLPRLYGRRFKPYVKQGFMSGGAGYVISRGGLKTVMSKGLSNLPNCERGDGGPEDVNFGRCAESAGVKAVDSRDSLSRERFHPLPPDSHLNPIDKFMWIWPYSFYPLKTGAECCSDTSIAFHYIAPEWMYILEYFVYHWHAYGIVRDFNDVRRFFGLKKIAPAAGDKIRREARLELAKAKVLLSETAQLKSDAKSELRWGKNKAQDVINRATKEADRIRQEVLKARRKEKTANRSDDKKKKMVKENNKKP